MKKKLLHIFPCVAVAFAFIQANAQDYQSIPIASGLNADVIANGIGAPTTSTSIDIDGVNYNYVSTDFQLNAASDPLTYGVPSNGLINSIVTATPGLSFQLEPLSGNNSLRLDADTTTGTITFETPVTAINLYMLAVTGSGAGTANVVVNFDDDTSQNFNNVSIPDWYNATNPPPAIMGIGRINRQTNVLEPNATNPRMYQITLAISDANQSKAIESVQVTQIVDEEEVVNVFAFSAEVYTSCPGPEGITYASADDGATIDWTAPEVLPSEGYDYYVSSSSDVPGEDVELTGTIDAEDTSITLSGYDTGETYYFWIRTNCDDVIGFWKMLAFTTGQMSTVYEDGHISSDYNGWMDPVLTTSSTSECPGTMTVTVPEGYQIASIATSYDIQSLNNAYQSEQRTLLVCTTNDTAEDEITFGPDENEGTASYNRTGIDIANELTGDVEFELRFWRTWGSTEEYDLDCGIQYNRVLDGTWTITITYEPVSTSDCDTPEAPEEQTVCGPATVADLMATGEAGAEINWYETGDSPNALGLDAEIETGSYFVSQSIGDCESDRVEIAVTVTNVELEAEMALVCEGGTVGDLMIEAGEGATVTWYETADSETALSADTVVEEGIYYASQTIGDCESERVAVEVGFVFLPPMDPGLDNEICEGTTILDMQPGIEGLAINFYAESEGGEPLPEDTELESGIYFITVVSMGCESEERAEAGFIMIATPEPDPNQSICGDTATIAQLDPGVEGEVTINWYDEEGNSLGQDYVLTSGDTYYVSTEGEMCGETEIAPVTVTITPIPDYPGGDDEQDFETGATVADLDVTPIEGGTITWYILDEDVWIEISADTPLVDGGMYFASQTVNGCEGPFLMITANEVLGASSFDKSKLKVYPNPVSEVLTIANEGLLSEVKVTNLLGQVVTSQKAEGNTVQVDMSGLASGNYILQVQSAEGRTIALKIVKQ